MTAFLGKPDCCGLKEPLGRNIEWHWDLPPFLHRQMMGLGSPTQLSSWKQQKGKPSTVVGSAVKLPLFKVKLAVRTYCAYVDEVELEPRTFSPFEKVLFLRMRLFPLWRHPETPGMNECSHINNHCCVLDFKWLLGPKLHFFSDPHLVVVDILSHPNVIYGHQKKGYNRKKFRASMGVAYLNIFSKSTVFTSV